MSLLNQQGLFISEALAQVITAPVKTTVRVAPSVVAPVIAPPTMAPLSLGAPLLTPSLTLPALANPVSPKAAAAVQANVAVAQAAVAAKVAPVAVPTAVQASLALPSLPGEKAQEAKGGKSELIQLGESLAKAKGPRAPASALNLTFDGVRRPGANGVTDPVPVGKAMPSRSGLAPAQKAGRKFIEFNVQYLRDIKKIFAESATKPNKQDYMWLVTKTFGLNLAIRAAFAVKGVNGGDLTLERAILSTAWYQIQDAVFTVFGQTYMKFLGKMTGMLRIGNAKLGDLLFVYAQLVGFEFLNRLVLGPIGENPLVYSAGGIGLLLLNNLQGMASGGLIIPVINKLRAAGLISEKTSNYLYQAASLTMHLGLLATFGYQGLFTVLTTALMILSWTAYIGLSFFTKPKPGLEPKL